METPAIADAMDALGVPNGTIDGLIRLTGSPVMVNGPVRTATVVDTDKPGIPGLDEFLDGVRPGDVLMFGWQALGPISSLGGLAARRVADLGCAGVISDGWVRDVAEIADVPLSVWARGSTPRSGKGRLAVVGIGAAARMGSLEVSEGDHAFADDTGICVVPAIRGDAVEGRARSALSKEVMFREALARGESFSAAAKLSDTM